MKEEIQQKEAQGYVTPYEFKGKLPMRQAIPLSLQHVLAMFVGNLTPILIITSACAAGGGRRNSPRSRWPCSRTPCWWPVSSRWCSCSR